MVTLNEQLVAAVSRVPVSSQVGYANLLRLALPSMLLQSASPAAITFQTALLGQKDTNLVAAWAVVSATTNSAAVVFNFLVVGVTAKVSKTVGARAWHEVGSRIRLALLCAMVAGVLAGSLLFAIEGGVFQLVHEVPEVVRPAKEYYMLRAIGFPSQLLAMSTTGILQGYKRVYLVAFIQICRLALEVCLSYVVIFRLDLGIRGVGYVNLLVITLSWMVSLLFILYLPPPEGRGKISVFGVAEDDGSAKGSAHSKLKAQLYEPLLGADQRMLYLGSAFDRGSTPAGHDEDEDEEGGVEDLGVKRLDRAPTMWTAPSVFDFSGADALALVAEEEGGGGGAVVGTAGPPPGQSADNHEKENPLQFIQDGLSTVVRSGLVQLSFFLALAFISSLGVPVMAAHQVVMQLWLCCTYLVDGFATAGTIIGSEIAGQMGKTRSQVMWHALLRDLRIMSHRLLYMGTLAGTCLGLYYHFFREDIIAAFTNTSERGLESRKHLRDLWPYLCLVQPMNAMAFVYDGLIFAAQAFTFMAWLLTFGFFCFYLPVLGYSWYHLRILKVVWFGKVMLNVVRVFGAGGYIHLKFLSPRNPFDIEVAGIRLPAPPAVTFHDNHPSPPPMLEEADVIDVDGS